MTGTAPHLHALASPTPELALAWCELERAPDELAVLSGWLSAEEHVRASRFAKPQWRARYVAGRSALRSLLGERLGCSPAAVQIVRRERGRPMLAGDAGIDFNVSHTAHKAVFALLTRSAHARVGVDIEDRARAPDVARLARRVMSPAERTWLAALAPDERRLAFLQLWTCKEAMSKATGHGIGAPFGQLDIQLTPLLRLREGPPPYDPGAWQLHRIDAIPGALATVALWRG